ncbi:hypothetical protein [Lysobacter sp. CA199]|uniref:hypothetical protein n=1 Tax=Lysobacter sp. CA199 TaxID=3455608 RepID=UPI003F8D3302
MDAAVATPARRPSPGGLTGVAEWVYLSAVRAGKGYAMRKAAMNTKALIVMGFVLGAMAAPAAATDKMMIDMQGESPNRVLVYVDDHSTDKSPIGDESARIREIVLTMVYEAAGQPYWTETDLQFKCPSLSYGKKASRKGQADETGVLPDADSAEFRMVEGHKRMKNSPNIETLSGSNWQTASNYLMLKVYRVACSDVAISQAKQAAAMPNGKMDPDALRRSMRDIGLDVAEFLPAEGLSMNMLASYTWEHFWKDAPKPALNNGRPLTAEESTALEKALKDQIATLEQRRDSVGARIKKMDDENRFIGEAAKLRGGRRISSTEQTMLSVWLGKGESDVVAAMGAPNVSEAGGIRFLTYFGEHDGRFALVTAGGAHVATQGLYESCQAQFVLKPDAAGAMRVADVVVNESRSGPGRAYVCSSLLNAPRN